ncbi:MAG: hypothetical protein K6C08_14740 [Oscillospiraceae bacterium]|nr:hypothetical protein [Oscillospiraceae bacterium]
MLSELIRRAEDGEPLWLPDLRDAFFSMPGTAALTLRLHRLDGSTEELEYRLPRWESPEERCFVEEYLSASVYNLLSAASGQELCFIYDSDNVQLHGLICRIPEIFRQPGYRKVLQVAERLCSASSLPPFRFSRLDRKSYHTEAEEAQQPSGDLAEILRRKVLAADHLTLCGIDIGGSDIKLALSLGGRLICTGEYDWNPAASATAEAILTPIAEQLLLLRRNAAELLGHPETLPLPDAIGVSFPDIVMDDRIVGGETPKTAGIRRSAAARYEEEFRKLSGLKELLLRQCRPGASVHIVNDGNMAAFTAAAELASGRETEVPESGLLAHTLGTDFGTGWLQPDATVPKLPLELYDLILDLGSRPASCYDPQDLRSTRNENSGLPGARRYLGQDAAFRLAYAENPSLLDGFLREDGEVLRIPTQPADLRKPCLQHLMQLAKEGCPEACQVFRQIGFHLGMISRELAFLLRPQTFVRYIYGRFVKDECCFSLLSEGCASCMPELRLIAPDENLAMTPLMRQLAKRPGVTVAQFGQAVGALYYAVKV